jgi:PmbA protein
MHDLEKIQKALLKAGMDDIILQKYNAEESMLKFVDNKIVKTGVESGTSIHIFVAKDKKLVTTSIKEFDDNSINNTVSKLTSFIKNSQANKNYLGIPDNKFSYPKIEGLFDNKIRNIDEVDQVEAAINASLENAKRTSGTFQASIGKVFILTSKGIQREEDLSGLYLSLRALKNKEASGHQTGSSRIVSKFNAEEIGRKAGEIAKLSVNPKEGVSGKYNVVFSPLAFAPILDNIGEACSIFSVESGMSFFQDKLEQQLGNFNLSDDGTLSNGFGSMSFDDEGHPTQKTEIVKEGIFKTFLHNTSSAQRHNTNSTGNAGIISPSPNNVILEGKTGDPFDIKEGIYLTNVWYTRFQNYVTGDFSTIPRDGMFMIRNGEIAEPIKNLRVSENVLNLLKNIELFGKDKEQITSWEASTPSVMAPVLIKNVNLTKPTG